MRTHKIVLFIALTVITAIIWFGISFDPGSYSHSEKYEIEVSESNLIKSIDSFKKYNPEYIVPEYLGLKDGQDKYWYYIYFYYPMENQIVITWLRQSGKDKTTFALVAVNDAFSQKGGLINKDFNCLENKVHKKKFEEKILNKIKELLN